VGRGPFMNLRERKYYWLNLARLIAWKSGWTVRRKAPSRQGEGSGLRVPCNERAIKGGGQSKNPAFTVGKSRKTCLQRSELLSLGPWKCPRCVSNRGFPVSGGCFKKWANRGAQDRQRVRKKGFPDLTTSFDQTREKTFASRLPHRILRGRGSVGEIT